MSNTDFIEHEIPFDDDDLFDRTEPSQGRVHFGHLHLYVVRVEKKRGSDGRWLPGQYFTIPGVTGSDRFDERDQEGLMKFKSFTAGGPDRLSIFVATKRNSAGEEYQMVRLYVHKRYTKDDHLDAADIIYPSLNETLTNAQKSKLTGEGFYAQWGERGTGRKFTPEGETEEKDIYVWPVDVVVFASKAEKEAAEAKHFGQFTAATTDNGQYPDDWGDYAADMLKHGAQLISDGTDLAEVAKTLYLLDKDGTPVENYKDLLKECVDTIDSPGPMKKEFYEKVETFSI